MTDAGSDSATHETSPAVKKSGGIIRKSFVIVFIATFSLVAAVLQWVVQPMIPGQIRDGLANRNLLLNEQSLLNANIWAGQLYGSDWRITETSEDGAEVREVLTAESLDLNTNIIDSVSQGSFIVDAVVLQDVRIRARDFARVLMEDIEAETDDEATSLEVPELPDLKTLETWWHNTETVREWIGEWWQNERDPAPEVKPSPDPNWDGAERHHPPLPSADVSMPKVPRLRFLIRELTVSSSDFFLSEENREKNPFDIATLALTGTNVTNSIGPDETMTLNGNFTTADAGGANFDFAGFLDRGTFELQWDEQGIPLSALSDPKVASPSVQAMGLEGQLGLRLQSQWEQDQLSGYITLTIIDLAMTPSNQAQNEHKQLARSITELRKLHDKMLPGEPFVLEWQLELGGHPWSPRITNLNGGSFGQALKDYKDQLLKGLKEQGSKAIEEGKDALKEEGKKLLQDVLQGKDPKESGEDSEDKLKDTGKKLLDRFKL